MKLNGDDISKYKMYALQGALNTLMAPPPLKKLVTNENASINGTMVIADPSSRKVDKHDINLMFEIKSSSIIDLQRDIDKIDTMLRLGKDNTGINELYVPTLERTYRLVYNKMSKYGVFGLGGKAIVTINFTEPDPTQRQC